MAPPMCDGNRNEWQRQSRAATIDNSYFASSTSSLERPKPRAEKRLSLPLRKYVQFTSMSDLLIFEHPAPNTWYTESDYQRFKEEMKRDVLSFRFRHESPPLDTSSCCPVGIEQLVFSLDRFEVYSARRIVVQSVLLEQDRQRVFGFYNPDEIASLSERLTADACTEALTRGSFQELAMMDNML